MRVSPFLTAIAKDYNPNIEYVAFCDLSKRSKKAQGIAWGKKNTQWHAIEIDEKGLICPHQILYIFFHELGHIVNHHLGYRYFTGSRSLHEEEADTWAFREMGMIDERGQVKEESKICYQCMKAKSKTCLKKIN